MMDIQTVFGGTGYADKSFFGVLEIFDEEELYIVAGRSKYDFTVLGAFENFFTRAWKSDQRFIFRRGKSDFRMECCFRNGVRFLLVAVFVKTGMDDARHLGRVSVDHHHKGSRPPDGHLI